MQSRTTIQLSTELRQELRTLAARRDVSYQELLSDMVSVFKELDREKTVISIPRGLARRIEDSIQDTDFTSVSEYVTFVLRTVLMESGGKASLDNEEVVREKLRALGYI